MFLGISIIGWGILVAAYVPVVLLLRWLARRSGTRSKAFITTAALTSLPFVAAIGEGADVESNWRALCATAKTEVKRKVIVEGFYDDGFWGDSWRYQAGSGSGYRFVEWKDKQGRIWRTEGLDGTSRQTTQIREPTARYHWQMTPFAVPVGHLLARREESIIDKQTGEVIAHHVAGYRYPGFVDRLWRQWFDDVPEECGTKRVVRGETLVGIDRRENAK